MPFDVGIEELKDCLHAALLERLVAPPHDLDVVDRHGDQYCQSEPTEAQLETVMWPLGSLALLERPRADRVRVAAHEHRQRHLDLRPKLLLVSAPDVPNHRDRKSTRLNSSHANISYAVF